MIRVILSAVLMAASADAMAEETIITADNCTPQPECRVIYDSSLTPGKRTPGMQNKAGDSGIMGTVPGSSAAEPRTGGGGGGVRRDMILMDKQKDF